VSANITAMLDREAERRGAPIREEEIERLSWASYQEGRRHMAVDYARAMQTVHAFGRTFSSIFSKCDVVLLSTNAKPPLPLGWMDTNATDLSNYGERLYTFMPNTQPFNVNGSPAMSMPLAWSDDGLPIGMQFAAAHGREDILLRLAAQIEQADPWQAKRPPISALPRGTTS
jgi:Asp-tRNA(Asn)/Glu-tRNA(Gln) amidotransferase A subunit family amidase